MYSPSILLRYISLLLLLLLLQYSHLAGYVFGFVSGVKYHKVVARRNEFGFFMQGDIIFVAQ
jgi:hypothetical protein